MPLITSLLHSAAQLSTFMTMYIWDFVKMKMGAKNKGMLVNIIYMTSLLRPTIPPTLGCMSCQWP